ncbi:hypothetical protein [Streptomyces sp. Ac-502]|uniref:hypothetical protein n=1 Tax=Streptomyces sp. Ac-502 TaxID=3342801 RepID=UPI0021FF4077|nr:transposase IS4 family protein [Streptomyces tumemacerans]
MAGLVRERTTQRTDSTHVLAAVRDQTRLELITEAVRAANPTHPKTRILATGGDAVRLIEHLGQHGPERLSGPARTGPARA